MAINLICERCKSNLCVRSRVCKSCGCSFGNWRKYRVVVKNKNGRRVSKVLYSFSLVKMLERKLKTQSLESCRFGITQTVIDEVWDKYLSWAKQHKKSWSKDLQRWQMHVQPHLRGKKMDAIMTYDLHFVINNDEVKKNLCSCND